jgi:hypothetical protein
MPPLPPAHTADLTVTASGAPMMRTPPPPAAPNAAEAALEAAMASARGVKHPAVSSYTQQARASAESAQIKHLGRIVLFAIALALACCLCEFCCSARRNYRPPGRPVPSGGGSFFGGSDAGSGISLTEVGGGTKLNSWASREAAEQELLIEPARYAGVAAPPQR